MRIADVFMGLDGTCAVLLQRACMGHDVHVVGHDAHNASSDQPVCSVDVFTDLRCDFCA